MPSCQTLIERGEGQGIQRARAGRVSATCPGGCAGSLGGAAPAQQPGPSAPRASTPALGWLSSDLPRLPQREARPKAHPWPGAKVRPGTTRGGDREASLHLACPLSSVTQKASQRRATRRPPPTTEGVDVFSITSLGKHEPR